jgi:hypothetical protein
MMLARRGRGQLVRHGQRTVVAGQPGIPGQLLLRYGRDFFTVAAR